MYTIVIGNKNYSSWSFRGWLTVRATGAAFEEILIPLDTEEWTATIGKFSPSGRVPVLIDGETTIWDTMAIVESLAERHPEAALWPHDGEARAHARSSSAEMHSGFMALRSAMPMNFRRPVQVLPLTEDVAKDVARISALWGDARDGFGHEGPYLYGDWSAADIMFAPVVSRFRTYGVEVAPQLATYMEAVEAHPHYTEWRDAGLEESWIITADEID